MSFLTDLFTGETIASVRARVISVAQSAGLEITNWLTGGMSQQEFEAHAEIAFIFAANVAKAIRGFGSLDSSTDPGDLDPYDSTNESLTPAPGYLSSLGAGQYGTPRTEETYATGFVTFTNAGVSAVTFAPDTLTFTWSGGSPPSPNPTYRNASDADIYVDPAGTITVAGSGGTATLPIEAEEIGTRSNAPSGTITLTTQPGPSCSATNAAAVLATDREGAEAYRARARIAPAALSPNGPADAYRYVATGAQEDSDGNVFYFLPGSTTGIGIDTDGAFDTFPLITGTTLGITRIYVSSSSVSGIVDIYLATASGAPSGGTVTKIKDLLDQVYWPDATTRNILPAVAVPIAIEGTVLVKAGAGVTTAAIVAAIDDALEAAFPDFAIGGYNQTLGAGTIYKDELQAIVNGAHPSIYSVTLSTPAGNTALAKGRVATLTNNIDSADILITTT